MPLGQVPHDDPRPLAMLKSCPFADTSTVMLPLAPATDTHSTMPPELLPDATTTVPILHHAATPSSSPFATTDSTLPPLAKPTDGVTLTAATCLELGLSPRAALRAQPRGSTDWFRGCLHVESLFRFRSFHVAVSFCRSLCVVVFCCSSSSEQARMSESQRMLPTAHSEGHGLEGKPHDQRCRELCWGHEANTIHSQLLFGLHLANGTTGTWSAWSSVHVATRHMSASSTRNFAALRLGVLLVSTWHMCA